MCAHLSLLHFVGKLEERKEREEGERGSLVSLKIPAP